MRAVLLSPLPRLLLQACISALLQFLSTVLIFINSLPTPATNTTYRLVIFTIRTKKAFLLIT